MGQTMFLFQNERLSSLIGLCMSQHCPAPCQFKTGGEPRTSCQYISQDAPGTIQSLVPCDATIWLQTTDSSWKSPSWEQPLLLVWDVNFQFFVWQSSSNFDEKLLLCPVKPLAVFRLCYFLRVKDTTHGTRDSSFLTCMALPMSQHLVILPSSLPMLLPGFKN